MELSRSLKKDDYMIVYRYNYFGKAGPVVRRREFSVISLEDLGKIRLPEPPSRLDIDMEPAKASKKLNSEFFMGFTKPVLDTVKTLYYTERPQRSILKAKPEAKPKKNLQIRLFSSAVSPQPISTIYNQIPAKQIIKAASQSDLPVLPKFGKSIQSIQNLVAYQDSYNSSLKNKKLLRLPPRKRFKIWDSPKYNFRMI